VPAAARDSHRECLHDLQRRLAKCAGRIRQDLSCIPDEEMNTAIQLPPTLRVFERGWLSSNNVLFLGREETALVDSGYATHAEQTVALVTHALGGRTLDRLVNTHLHSDHCGGNAALQATFQ